MSLCCVGAGSNRAGIALHCHMCWSSNSGFADVRIPLQFMAKLVVCNSHFVMSCAGVESGTVYYFIGM